MAKSSRGVSIVGILLLIVVVGVIGAMGFIMFSGSDTGEPILKANPPAKKEPAVATAGSVIGKLKSNLAENFTVKEFQRTDDSAVERTPAQEPATGTLSLFSGDTAAYDKAADGDFYALAGQGVSLDVVMSKHDYEDNGKVADRLRKAIAQSMKDSGLTQADDESLTNARIITYKADSVVCQIAAEELRANPQWVSCSDRKDIDAAATQLEPLVAAYVQSDKATKGDKLLMRLTGDIANSAAAGYKTAKVGISVPGGDGGSAGMFYKKGRSDWTFFTSGQMLPGCAEFDKDPDAKTAFKGDDCLDAATGAVTKVQ